MRKSLITKAVAQCAAFFLCCLIPLESAGQTGEKTVDALVKMGFVNVGWTEDDDERVYVLQNDTYRRQAAGISKAIEVIQKEGLPDEKPCRIVVLNNNVPQISLYYSPLGGDSATLEAGNAANWKVSYELGDTWSKRKRVKLKNRSMYKVDVLLYPQLSFKNLIITQIYQVLFDISPAVEVSLWKGGKVSGQIKLPIYNDGYGRYEDKVHPGNLTVSQRFRLPYNVFGKATVGYFSNNRYGADLTLFHPFKFDNRFSVRGQVGYTAMGYWDGFKLHYDTDYTCTWSLAGNFYWPQFNTQFSLKAEQYTYEKGWKFEMVRYFRYCCIGFFAAKGEHLKTNGGFRFQVLLPPYKYKRRGYIPRFDTSANMGIIYNSRNIINHYQQYKAESSDNIMEENSFNPYYIKSELLNF